MKRKILYIFFVLAGLVMILPFLSSRLATWHIKDVSEVRAYRINWDEEFPHPAKTILDERWEFNESRLPALGIKLSEDQQIQLKRAVYGLRWPVWSAACFYPHHSFVLYDSKGSPVGAIDICFKCDRVRFKPKGFTPFYDIEALRNLFEELDVPIEDKSWR